MFDLEKAITDWRQQMLSAGIKTPVPLEELEVHLRDEIERQTKSGLNGTEAFKSAVQIIGQAQAVQSEFEKVETVNEARDSKKQQFVKIVVLGSLGLSLLVVGRAILSNSEMTFGQRVSSLAAIAAMLLLAGGGPWSCGIFPAMGNRRIRDAVGVLGSLSLALWWIVFLRLIVPYYDFTVSQFVVAFVWAFFPPAGAWVGLFLGVEAAVRKNFAATDLSAIQN